MKKNKLTPKQEQFCREYVVDFNATQAAIRAGYSKKTARQIGEQNLSKVYIAERVKELKKPREDAPKNLREKILKRLETIAFTDLNEFMENEYYEDPDTGEKTFYSRRIKEDLFESDKLAAIAGLEPGAYGTKLKFKDQLKAIEMLSRHIGLFNEDTTQKPEVNQYDFTNISSEKLRAIKKILSED